MTNILKYDLLDAAEFRRTVALTYPHDQAARNIVKRFEGMAAANDSDPLLVQKYSDCLKADPDKLNRIKRAIMYKIGYDFYPKTPDDVLAEIIMQYEEPESSPVAA